MAEKVKLKKTALAKLEPVNGQQTIYWDSEQPGFGVRVSNGRLVDGVREYGYTFFCQGRLRGKVTKVTIGKAPTFSPDLARKKAREYLGKMAAGIDPRVEKETANGSATFGEMMLGYAEWLEDQGKVSAAKVKREIENDIQKPFRTLWKRPANKITIDDCDRILERLEKAKKPRQADKIRSYMKTAFRKAINARRNRRYPDGLKLADVKTNPCNDIEKVAGSSKARDRALSLAEFRAYWTRVKEQPEPRRSLMMLHVLTGGQRLDQLGRATMQDIDRDAPSLTLLDYKGRRTEPRRHTIPLLPEALAAIDRITGGGEYVFSCDGGKRAICNTYMRDAVARIEKDMEEAKELENGHFTPGSIRATIETRLAAKPYRVSSDVLGQLLSHGLGGVQARHYQHHDFFEEKLEALEMLHRMAEGLPEPVAQVIPFNREASA
ncbi:tyrosine-type recombinase/integrase [Marinobacter sp. MBR-105]